jgi:hypothetical protein
MCVVPGPVSQDAVLKRIFASPVLKCSQQTIATYPLQTLPASWRFTRSAWRIVLSAGPVWGSWRNSEAAAHLWIPPAATVRHPLSLPGCWLVRKKRKASDRGQREAWVARKLIHSQPGPIQSPAAVEDVGQQRSWLMQIPLQPRLATLWLRLWLAPLPDLLLPYWLLALLFRPLPSWFRLPPCSMLSPPIPPRKHSKISPLKQPEVKFMNVFSWCRVDSRSLRSTLSYESTLMEFTDNLSKPPDFFFLQEATKDEWTCLYKIIN